MSKAAELAALIGSQTALSNRNFIINGAATVSQRGDSTGKTATGYYGPDRYQLTLNSLGTWSISQSTDVPSGEGFGNSYKLEATTADASPAAGDYAIFLQKIEGQNLQQLKKGTSSAESVTLSFYVRSSKTGTYIVELFDNDNSRSISKSYTISSANTWERKTITFPGDTTGTLGNDNASTTLSKCKRYYQLMTATSYIGGFHAYTGSTGVWFPTVPSMRAAPTVTDYNVRNASSGATATGQSANYGGVDGFVCPIDGAGGADTNVSHINQATIEASAEL